MDLWNCCRTCLDSQCLNPIFSIHENDQQSLIDTIHFTVGIKVDPNDNLPHHICLKCLNFIYEIVKFRKKVDSIQIELLKKLESNEFIKIKPENKLELKLENDIKTSIDTEDSQDDFKDYDDNTTLDNLQFARQQEKINEIETKEYETTVKDIVDLRSSIIFNNEGKKKRATTKTVKRKTRCKKENTDGQINSKGNKEKKERIKEEIECEYCHKILTSKLSLRNHYKIHTGFDVVCEHCGKKFITRRLLLMHCRAKHGYEKTDKCSYCDYKASNAEQVKIHERLHTGEKPYVCAECGAGFHRKSSYLQHVAIHLPEKTVQCDQCPARFKSVTLMRIHASRHRLPSYRFRCGVCGNSFARRRNVARHLTRVHATPPDAKHIVRLKI